MASVPSTETATLGGGCFWCIEAVMEMLAGVTEVVPGYAGGHVANPSYEQVCTGRTGHAEVVQVTFDPSILSYGDLLDVFFSVHDPTTIDRQGPDIGTQYRSIVLYHDERQQRTAREKVADLEARGDWGAPIVTQIVPLEAFWPAEDYHRGYFRRNPDQAYCRIVIQPKVAKARAALAGRLKEGAG